VCDCETYPVGAHLDDIRLAIFIFAEGLVPGSATDCVAVFKDREIVNRGIAQRLLWRVS
jgi:hypothetical protein